MNSSGHPGFTSHAERYSAIRGTLASWSALWAHSVLDRFELMEDQVPEEWFHYGVVAEHSSQYLLGQGQRLGHGSTSVPESLWSWISELLELSAVPSRSIPGPIQSSLAGDLTPKKRHEIQCLLGYFKEAGPIERILDIGGGAGHLARHLALELKCSVDSIDRDPALHDKARRILEKSLWRRALQHPVQFKTEAFSVAGCSDPVGPRHWAVGLHTCGPLAWSHLELVERGYSILNVGCCYEKLNLIGGVQCSDRVRRNPLPWTDEALYLVDRGGLQRTWDEFEFQQRMQRHRFSLHELLRHQGVERSRCQSVGSASQEIYQGRFYDYVRDRLKHSPDWVDALSPLSEGACEDFCRQVGPRVEKMRFIAYLRNLLARPLELAILLDRALFAEENGRAQGHRVQLIQIFDPALSPRNVALVVQPA